MGSEASRPAASSRRSAGPATRARRARRRPAAADASTASSIGPRQMAARTAAARTAAARVAAARTAAARTVAARVAAARTVAAARSPLHRLAARPDAARRGAQLRARRRAWPLTALRMELVAVVDACRRRTAHPPRHLEPTAGEAEHDDRRAGTVLRGNPDLGPGAEPSWSPRAPATTGAGARSGGP